QARESIGFPGLAQDATEGVPLPLHLLEHVGELCFVDEQALVGDALVNGFLAVLRLLGDRVADRPDKTLAARQATEDPTTSPVCIERFQSPARVPPGGALARLGGSANEHQEFIESVDVLLGDKVRTSTDGIAETDQQLQ